MNLINKYFLLGVLLIASVSCSEDAMDDVNENKNFPKDVQTYLSITEIEMSTSFNVIGGDFNFYSSVYMEHNVGVFGQMYNAEIRVSEPYASSTYDNSWKNAYANLKNLRTVIAKCSEGGSEAGNFRNLAVAQVLAAINLGALTDLMGDTPWSESGQPGVIYQPKLDAQKDIYVSIFQFLDDAIANLDKVKTTDANQLSAQDLIYKGNIDLWKKAAYGLKARYTLRLSLRDAKYQEVLDFAAKSFAATADQFLMNYNGGTSNNPNYKFFTDRDYFGSSKSLQAKLSERNDPRASTYFVSYPGASSLEIAPNGTPNQAQKKYGISGLLKASNPTYLMSYHELLFIQAEAVARLGKKDDANAFLQKAIEVAFVKVGLTSAAANTYFAGLQSKLSTNLLQEIMIQKYIAFFDDESLEAYNDYRRLMGMNENFVTLANTKAFPLRFTYGNSDVTTNKKIEAAYGNGQYVQTEKVWWAGGSR